MSGFVTVVCGSRRFATLRGLLHWDCRHCGKPCSEHPIEEDDE